MKKMLMVWLLLLVAAGAGAQDNFNILDKSMSGNAIALGSVPDCMNGKDVIMLGNTLACSVGTPVLTSCGLNPTMSGTDFEGRITVGTGLLTSCTVTFSKALSGIPKCLISGSGGLMWISSLTASALTVNATSLGGAVVWYKCWGAA